MAKHRRVVITGVGAITPLGLTASDSWENVIVGKSGVKVIDRFNTDRFRAKIAGLVDLSQDGFNPEKFISKKDIRKMDLFIQYGVAAAAEAINDSNWMPTTEDELDRTGILIGSGIGGLREIESTSVHFHQGISTKVSPFFIPAALTNLVSGHIAMKYGFSGPNSAVSTACSTGTQAVGDATRMIQYGDADVMIAGGTEASITPIGVAGFGAARALSTQYNASPEKASRPWDKDRDGFIMSEGAGIVVLEEYEHARRRNAQIYAEIAGYGMSGDAYHITAPHPEGKGAKSAIKRALNDAGIHPDTIDYINAHGTSTPIGDSIELSTVESIFYDANRKVKMSSTKSSLGHLLGAAGAVEIVLTSLAIQHQVAPPTLNLNNPIDGAKMNLVAHEAQDTKIHHALSNSFAFGGTNASIILKKL